MIVDYTTLQAAVGNWLNRADLSARIPEFIQLAEARFRRKLDDVDQDIVAQITFTDGIAPLPADFGSLRELTDGCFPVPSVTYDILAGEIQASPAVDGTATILYKQSLPALSNSVTTNWLLTRAPDIYLFGSLIQAEFFGWNDERLPLIKSAVDEMLAELIVDSETRRWNRNSLAPRIRRSGGSIYGGPVQLGDVPPDDYAGIIQ